MSDPKPPHWVDEREPFPAFLRTLSDLELVALQHEARLMRDDVTLQAVMRELHDRGARRLDQWVPEIGVSVDLGWGTAVVNADDTVTRNCKGCGASGTGRRPPGPPVPFQ